MSNKRNPPEAEMDWSQAKQQKSDRGRQRAVVSVAFARDDFDRLDRHVEAQGVKLSEYIRSAVLDRVASEQSPIQTSTALAAAGYYAPEPRTEISAERETAGTAAETATTFSRVA